MPRGRERRLLYVRERREDGTLTVRAIPLPEGEPVPQIQDLQKKVS